MKLQKIGLTLSILLLLNTFVEVSAKSFTVAPGSDSAAIQKIIDEASVAKEQPVTVLFSKGEYTIDATIQIKKPVILKGQGKETKLIVKKQLPLERGDIRPAIRIEGADSVVIEGLSFSSALENEIDDIVIFSRPKIGSTAIFSIDCKGLRISKCTFD